jgi:hypothetical protein
MLVNPARAQAERLGARPPRPFLQAVPQSLPRGLSEGWNGTSSGPQKMKHPVMGEDILVWVRALKFIAEDGTFVLEGQVRFPRFDCSMHFH